MASPDFRDDDIMNNSNPLFDELVTSFRELKSFQAADEIRSVLLEFVSPQLIERGFVHFKHYPEEWWNTRVLIDEQAISDPRPGSERIYKILVIPYRGENQILLDENSGPPLPERLQIMTKQVEDCLELAGQTLLDDPASQNLPIEITGVKNPVQAWLMFLHYITKPERTTWKRVNRVAAMGKIFGVPDIDKGDFGPPNMDSLSTVGKFSFNHLQDNSFSVVRDIATCSIRAVRIMEQGLIEETKPPVTVETEKRLTTTQIRKIATEYNESRTKEHDGYTSDWISSKVKKKIWPEYDQKSSGPKPANWKLNTIKPYLLRDVSFVPAEIWDEKAILHDIRPT